MNVPAAPDRTEPTPLDLRSAAGAPAEVTFERLGSSEAGLTSAEAAARLKTFGANVLHSQRVTVAGILLRQLRNPLLVLLLAAAATSGLTGNITDGAIISAIVVLSVGLGFVNEYRSARAVAALHGDIHYEALVWRDGAQREVDVSTLVPGDVLALRVGDVVPADLRILETNQLECDEAVLTGESMPSTKVTAASPASDSAVDLPSCAFMGTLVHQGSGKGVVVSTGAATAFGAIATGLGARQAETAFQVSLRGFSRLLVKVAGVLTISIFIINVAFSRPLLEALLFQSGDRDRDHAAAASGDRVGEPFERLEGAGAQAGAGQAAGHDRGPGQHRGPVHRQDRHPHRRGHYLPAGDRCRRQRRNETTGTRARVQRSDDDV